MYLDPSFNSNANYNVLFEEHGAKGGRRRAARAVAPAANQTSMFDATADDEET